MGKKKLKNLGVDDTSSLKVLGSNSTNYKYDSPVPEILETFPNNAPQRDYLIELKFPEFTSLCPKTGQPDFARIQVRYIADKVCLESKSIKLYFFAYRNYGSFMETITNKILTDFVEACQPRWMEVTCNFNPRGGLEINPTVTYTKPGFVKP